MSTIVGELASALMTFASHLRRSVAITFLAAICGAACSDDSGSSGAAGTTGAGSTDSVSACDLLTTAEATAAMGKPMADGTETETDGGTLCKWLSTDPPSEGLDEPTNLTVALLAMRPAAQMKIDTLAASSDHRVVPGLGDLAVAECSFGDTEHCGELYVVIGDQYLDIDMGNFVWPGDYDPAELLGIVSEVAGQAVLRVRK